MSVTDFGRGLVLCISRLITQTPIYTGVFTGAFYTGNSASSNCSFITSAIAK